MSRLFEFFEDVRSRIFVKWSPKVEKEKGSELDEMAGGRQIAGKLFDILLKSGASEVIGEITNEVILDSKKA